MKNKAFFLFLDSFLMFLITSFLLISLLLYNSSFIGFEKTAVMQKLADSIKVTQLQAIDSTVTFKNEGSICPNLKKLFPDYKITTEYNNSISECNNIPVSGNFTLSIKTYIFSNLKLNEIKITLEK